MSSKRSCSIIEGTMRSISRPGRCTRTRRRRPISESTRIGMMGSDLGPTAGAGAHCNIVAMLSDSPQNPLYERYASAEMARLFSPQYRFHTWRKLWITLADCERELGLPITEEQITALQQVAEDVDLARVAELERRTRHDVVAHLRHFAEQADAVHPGAGGILHLGATSAFITDNTDVVLAREALKLLAGRLAATLSALAGFARRTRTIPCLAYTHFQPAQLTTVGK